MGVSVSLWLFAVLLTYLEIDNVKKMEIHIYFFKYSSICSGSVISPLRSEQLLFYAPFEKTGENENTTMGEGDGTKQNKTKTKTKFTQKNKPISAKVTSWPSSSAEHRLQSSENLPYQCFVSCPGVPLL